MAVINLFDHSMVVKIFEGLRGRSFIKKSAPEWRTFLNHRTVASLTHDQLTGMTVIIPLNAHQINATTQ